MSCAAALAAALILAPAPATAAAAPTSVAVPQSLAGEPLYAEIVSRSKALHRTVEAMKAAAAGPLPGLDALRAETQALAALDMKGHLDLKARNTDGDLKCILRGISEDLPGKVAAVEEAATPAQRVSALDELAYLLDDNSAVILAPPTPPV
jgi:hypothetical protein